MSNSQFTTGQSWGALRKAWKAYRIAKVKNDSERMEEYAKRIQKLQNELGLDVASFKVLQDIENGSTL